MKHALAIALGALALSATTAVAAPGAPVAPKPGISESTVLAHGRHRRCASDKWGYHRSYRSGRRDCGYRHRSYSPPYFGFYLYGGDRHWRGGKHWRGKRHWNRGHRGGFRFKKRRH